MCIHLFRCDADPAALAKYVLALAKKEKPESELRGAMCDQLDVFLQQETKGFVDKLFVTLETKSYLQSNPEPPSVKVESTTVAATTTEQVNVGVTNGQNLVIPPVAVPVQPPLPVPVISAPSNDSRTKKSSSDRTKRRSWSPRSRSRSRSRDRDRDRPVRRSRSRDRSTRDHRGGRSTWDDRRGNRRSPVNNRRSDRRRSRSPLPPRRSSRSPRGSRQQRARSPIPPLPVVAGLENVVVAPGLGLVAVGGTAADPAIVVGVPVPSAAIQSVVVAPSTAAQQQHERGPKFRCRDYDEKGYCMRGDLCPYDHGADPVVLEDVELSSMLSSNYNRPPPSVGTTTGASGAPPGPLPVGPPPHLRGPPPSLPPSGK